MVQVLEKNGDQNCSGPDIPFQGNCPVLAFFDHEIKHYPFAVIFGFAAEF